MNTATRPQADTSTPAPLPEDLFELAELLGRTAAVIKMADDERRTPVLAALHPDRFGGADLAAQLLFAGRVLAGEYLLADHLGHLAELPNDGLTALSREVWAGALILNRSRITAAFDRAAAADLREELLERIQQVAGLALSAWTARHLAPDPLTAAAEQLGVPAERLAELRADPLYRRTMNAARGEYRPHVVEPPPPPEPEEVPWLRVDGTKVYVDGEYAGDVSPTDAKVLDVVASAGAEGLTCEELVKRSGVSRPADNIRRAEEKCPRLRGRIHVPKQGKTQQNRYRVLPPSDPFDAVSDSV